MRALPLDRAVRQRRLLRASAARASLLDLGKKRILLTDEEAAEEVKKLVKDADLQEKLFRQMESALKGTVPTPWP